MEECSNIAKVFKALCDETRVTIIQFLGSSEKCACDISEKLNISQSKLSYHMKILCESGLIDNWYVGKWTYYKISETGSKNAINILSELTNLTEGNHKE